MSLFQVPERPRSLELYPHQSDCLESLRAAFREGHKRILLVMPTGAGKSETAAKMQELTSLAGSERSWFAVHRRGLVRQFSQRLSKYGISHGIIMAGETYQLRERVQVASIDTLDARYLREHAPGSPNELPAPKLIIYDEAHTHAEKAQRLMDAYPDAWVIGLTATPAPADGKGLGRYGYTKIVEGPTVAWLMANGYLVPKVRYFGPEKYDYSKVKVGRNGEYVESSADEVVNTPQLVGNVVEQYKRFGMGRPFVVFANSVAHSRNLSAAFNREGLTTLHIDADTPHEVREAAYQGLEAGEVDGLTNYGILDRGFDAPIVSVCILARKVRHISTYRQMAGRVLRQYPGKSECILIDHGGNVTAHGFVDDEIEWTLDPEVDLNQRERERREANPEKQPVECKNCGAVVRGSVCRECGTELPKPKPKADTTEFVDGELGEITVSPDEKRRWYCELLWIANERGYARGWASQAYRERFKVWPQKKQGLRPHPPSDEVRAFAMAKIQAYARRAAYAKKRRASGLSAAPGASD